MHNVISQICSVYSEIRQTFSNSVHSSIQLKSEFRSTFEGECTFFLFETFAKMTFLLIIKLYSKSGIILNKFIFFLLLLAYSFLIFVVVGFFGKNSSTSCCLIKISSNGE